MLSVHAEGAQVYECKAGTDGKLAWAFREPIATLLLDGKTVGRHYAGPNWEHVDGSAVVGKVVGSAPGATPNDIAWLKLGVISQRGSGVLARCHHGAADQHARRKARRRLRQGQAPSEARPTRRSMCSCARGNATAIAPSLRRVIRPTAADCARLRSARNVRGFARSACPLAPCGEGERPASRA